MARSQDIAALIEHSNADAWVEHAACGDLDIDQLDLFFVDAGRTLSKEAISLCSTCPVRAECLAHAMNREIGGGYFGGVSPSKRRTLSA
jgi:WhiB family transcriptional regulator, redox-sensing transcriptional regulator